jgi:hypothetical protein
MKINKFIIAGTALALSVVTSQANNPALFNLPGGNAWSLICIPWSAGQNTALELESYFQGGENLWIRHGSAYYEYTYQGYGAGTSMGYPSDFTDATGTASMPGDVWDPVDGVYWTVNPVFSPGQSFFIQNPNSTYNVALYGSGPLTETVNITGGGAYNFVGNATTVPNQNAEGGSLNLTANFVGGENVCVWTGSRYYIYTFEGVGAGTSLGYQSDWIDASSTPPSLPVIPGDQTDTSNDVYWAPPLILQVGEGLIITNPNANETWVQNIVW